MKVFLIFLLAIDVILVAGAVIRFSTATPDTQPLISLDGSSSAQSASASSSGAGIGETGAGGAFVDHMRQSQRVDEIATTGSMSTGDPGGNAEYNAGKALESASAIEDGRQDDLDDAKAKIGQIGK